MRKEKGKEKKSSGAVGRVTGRFPIRSIFDLSRFYVG
jgi:hypothetical protein